MQTLFLCENRINCQSLYSNQCWACFAGDYCVATHRATSSKQCPYKKPVFQFSLISLLFINLKQPKIIILFMGMALVSLGKHVFPRIQRLLRLSPILIVPALLSYLLWRNFVFSDAYLHEATLLPFEQRQYQNIPAILSSFCANVVKRQAISDLWAFLLFWQT